MEWRMDFFVSNSKAFFDGMKGLTICQTDEFVQSHFSDGNLNPFLTQPPHERTLTGRGSRVYPNVGAAGCTLKVGAAGCTLTSGQPGVP
jgi:hypothetical protein